MKALTYEFAGKVITKEELRKLRNRIHANNSKDKARGLRVENPVTLKWLEEKLIECNWMCHYSGKEMDTSGDWAVSVDRRDNNRGHDITNCVLCCHVFNNMRNDKTYSEFKQFLPDLLLVLSARFNVES